MGLTRWHVIVALEGIDCAGKTTLCNALLKRLAGDSTLAVTLVEEFPREFIGGHLKDLVENRGIVEFEPDGRQIPAESLVLIANDYFRLERATGPQPNGERIAIFDRLAFGVLAYQAVRSRRYGRSLGLVPELITQMLRTALNDRLLICWLKLDQQELARRLAFRGIDSIDYVHFLLEVQAEYESMSSPDWAVLNGAESQALLVQQCERRILDDTRSSN